MESAVDDMTYSKMETKGEGLWKILLRNQHPALSPGFSPSLLGTGFAAKPRDLWQVNILHIRINMMAINTFTKM